MRSPFTTRLASVFSLKRKSKTFSAASVEAGISRNSVGGHLRPANELRSCLARRWLLLMQGTISLLGGWTEGNLKFLITFSSLLLHHIASEREMRKEKSMIECRGREMRNHQLSRATQWSAGVITSRALFALSSIYIDSNRSASLGTKVFPVR